VFFGMVGPYEEIERTFSQLPRIGIRLEVMALAQAQLKGGKIGDLSDNAILEVLLRL
jgi:hypothetical protein